MARLGLYQPFIEDRNVRRLYRLKMDYRERTGRKVPMTSLVNQILDDYFESQVRDVADSPAGHAELGPEMKSIGPH